MTILDISTVERVKERRSVSEDVTVVTFIEYPQIIYYERFYGGVIFPIGEDFILTHKIQLKLLDMGRA